ncbi:MAG: biotin carboxylase N-terminal domain-containing protein [Planctomycetota bacterium]|nr:biotin carboxylase N-terminal domain-containing protein [Planctomycetota bacterium]
MFHRLLIANRGEVAVRIARAARELGVSPIGVASTADLDSAWARSMDAVVPLGPGAPTDSYLQASRIVQAARQERCSAIHPGWGFLAENATFAAMCRQHGIQFVGPSPELMTMMGLKSPAKAAMKAAGLPVIPGSDGPLEDVDEAASVAAEVGYPVILKADAGGGGRGMRLCHSEDELRAAFGLAQAEALSSFGLASVYLEKYLTGGRHIEVQVLVDRYGHAIHLGERECSIQRRHQKLIEESPSPALTQAERDELGALAAAASARVGYEGAGTIEFLRSPDTEAERGQLFFMEMNTRLQVEHPVSEEVSGIDLPVWQLRIAAGQPLTIDQHEVVLRGHAIEARINAEDPSADFRPSPGKLTAFDFDLTAGGPGTRLRLDTHLATGETVPPHYDSLLGKLIAHGPDRAAAIAALEAGLAAAKIEGVPTTIPLHRAVLASEAFASGDYDTASIPGWPPAS